MLSTLSLFRLILISAVLCAIPTIGVSDDSQSTRKEYIPYCQRLKSWFSSNKDRKLQLFIELNKEAAKKEDFQYIEIFYSTWYLPTAYQNSERWIETSSNTILKFYGTDSILLWLDLNHMKKGKLENLKVLNGVMTFYLYNYFLNTCESYRVVTDGENHYLVSSDEKRYRKLSNAFRKEFDFFSSDSDIRAKKQ
jgi:hypothetical protein